MPVQVFVRQHKFSISCDKNDEPLMLAAAQNVEDKFKEIRGKSRVADGEKTAVMTALQIAFEAQKKQPSAPPAHDPKKIAALIKRIDNTLSRTDKSLQERASNGMNQ